jgi:hypothetical protein
MVQGLHPTTGLAVIRLQMAATANPDRTATATPTATAKAIAAPSPTVSGFALAHKKDEYYTLLI